MVKLHCNTHSLYNQQCFLINVTLTFQPSSNETFDRDRVLIMELSNICSQHSYLPIQYSTVQYCTVVVSVQ